MSILAEDRSHPGIGTTTMRVLEIDPMQDPRWRPFIEAHSHSSVFHRPEWLAALKSCYGYVPVALTSSPPGSPLENGLLFCEVRSALTGNRLVSLPFSDHCEPLVSDAEELDVLLASLREKIDYRGWKYFELRPVFHKPNGHSGMGLSQSYCFHRLDLRPSEQSLFQGFHKDCVQRKIRRAERESLRYEEGFSDVLLKHFYKLLIITRRRQSLPPQPLKWFRSLIASLGKKLKISVAFKGEIPVASILTLSDKRTLVYKYGCSDGRFNNLGGTALLFWNAIQDAKAKGIEELDMGRSDTDAQGLITFKEHWGATRSAVNYWRYPVQAAASRPECLIRYAKQIISIAPDVSLVMLGQLLYRHIG
jgi:CelD/BcsL family acetyltransferase involved in cellulose biosynthesis